MFYEEHNGFKDQLITIKRNAKGDIVKKTDSNHKPLSWHVKAFLTWLFTGKKVHLTMTNAGFAVTSELINGVGGTAFTYTAIGTGTTASAATDTTLQSEAKRKVGTQTQQTTTVTNDTSQWDTVFSSSDGLTGTTSITEVGVLNASTGGTLLVHFASTTVLATCTWANGDTFEVIVKIKSEQGS